jgi:acyl carrier protein
MKSVPAIHDLERQVTGIVAASLDIPASDVASDSSLVDDLGAESIDFIDIVFRLETAFDTLVPNDQLWAGSNEIDGNDPETVGRVVAQLRVSMPNFAWDRFPSVPTKRDLPRLISVHTIAGYLRRHLAAEAAGSK